MTPPETGSASLKTGWRSVARWLLPFAFLIACHSGPARATADDATPTAATPVAGRCDVPPVGYEELERLRTVTSFDSSLVTPGVLPAGIPVDSTTAEVLRGRVEGFLACSCAGEPLRVFEFYSERYLAELISRERGFDRHLYELWAEPRPAPPEDCPVLRSASGARLLADGRAASLVRIFYPNIEKEKEFVFTFTRACESWLIDDIQGEISFSLP